MKSIDKSQGISRSVRKGRSDGHRQLTKPNFVSNTFYRQSGAFADSSGDFFLGGAGG